MRKLLSKRFRERELQRKQKNILEIMRSSLGCSQLPSYNPMVEKWADQVGRGSGGSHYVLRLALASRLKLKPEKGPQP